MIADGYNADLDELRRLQRIQENSWFLLNKGKAARPVFRICAWPITRARLLHRGDQLARRQSAERLPATPDAQERRAYITPELKQFEDKALSARDRALALEKSLYENAREAERLPASRSEEIAKALAQVDVLAVRSPCAETELRAAAIYPGALHRHRGRAPHRRRGADRVHRQRLPDVADAPPPPQYRSEHGRQVDLHAPGRPHRAPRAHWLVRPGARRASAPARSTRSSRASARPTTSQAGARPSWWK